MAVNLSNPWHSSHGFLYPVACESSLAIHHYLVNRSSPIGDDWRATCHRLDHDQPKWLRPVDGKDECISVTKKLILVALSNFSDELYVRLIQQRFNRLFKVLDIRIVNLGCDAKRHPGTASNLNRMV